jgi:integrase
LAHRTAYGPGRRITGHSFRRGWIQQALAAGNPPETVALHSRHSLRSTAFDAYRRKRVPWGQNPTRFLGLAA